MRGQDRPYKYWAETDIDLGTHSYELKQGLRWSQENRGFRSASVFKED